MIEIRSYDTINEDIKKLGDISDDNLDALFKLSLEKVTNLYKLERMTNKQIRDEVRKETGKFSLTYLKKLRAIMYEKRIYLKNAEKIKTNQRYIFKLTVDKYKRQQI